MVFPTPLCGCKKPLEAGGYDGPGWVGLSTEWPTGHLPVGQGHALGCQSVDILTL